MTSTIEILKAAKKLIEDPARWTQGALARDINGIDLDGYDDSSAVCWCAQGAVEKVGGVWCDAYPILNAVVDNRLDAFYKWQDTHTHAEVLAAFDKAIAKLYSREG